MPRRRLEFSRLPVRPRELCGKIGRSSPPRIFCLRRFPRGKKREPLEQIDRDRVAQQGEKKRLTRNQCGEDEDSSETAQEKKTAISSPAVDDDDDAEVDRRIHVDQEEAAWAFGAVSLVSAMYYIFLRQSVSSLPQLQRLPELGRGFQ